MKSSRLTLHTLTCLLLASTYAANADATERYLSNGLSLSTASQLLPNSFVNRNKPDPAPLANDEMSPPTSRVTEEIVVTATRIRPTGDEIAPPLRRLFSEIEAMKTQKSELVWLSSMSRKGRSRVKLGYDPEFEFHNRFTATLPSASSMERLTPSVLRLSF